jgi:hypothetical protein
MVNDFRSRITETHLPTYRLSLDSPAAEQSDIGPMRAAKEDCE